MILLLVEAGQVGVVRGQVLVVVVQALVRAGRSGWRRYPRIGSRLRAPADRVRADLRGEVRPAGDLEPAEPAVAAGLAGPREEHRQQQDEHEARSADPHHRTADVYVVERARRPART